ncbi:MAG TPA: dTDP-4-dehydrorhamnose reductase [Bacteroidales bacterium]
MKILVTGSKGQLGNELRELASEFPQFDFLYTDVEELDITDAAKVRELFADNKPDVVINCAAYTAVDKAESDETLAYLINATAVGILAQAAAKHKALMIHISTDYVFDGKAYSPYQETDKTNPVSAYARTKYAGEQAVEKYAAKAIIIRTSWLYSAFGNNFVKTILKYGKERDLLNIVFDQIGTPTYARDLARTILTIIPQASEGNGIEVYHYSNEGVASWYDFAKAIVEISGLQCRINPIGTKDYPLPATRPFYSVLDKSKLKEKFMIEIPYWRDSLMHCLLRMGDVK